MNLLTPFGLVIHPSVSFRIGQQNLTDLPFKMYSILAQDPEHPTCFPAPLAQGSNPEILLNVSLTSLHSLQYKPNTVERQESTKIRIIIFIFSFFDECIFTLQTFFKDFLIWTEFSHSVCLCFLKAWENKEVKTFLNTFFTLWSNVFQNRQ